MKKTVQFAGKGYKTWLKKIGIWGFLFFLVKGLVWLAIGYWVIS
jgi:hypothetical protein